MASSRTQERLADLQRQLAEAQRKASLYGTPYIDANGNPVESVQQAGRYAAGSRLPSGARVGDPMQNENFDPKLADSYLQQSDRLQQQLTDAYRQASAEDQPSTTVHSTGSGGLVAVTASKNPDDTGQKITTTDITPANQILNMPGLGVVSVDPKTKEVQVLLQQGLTPAEQIQANYQGHLAYANWLNAQVNAGTLDEKKREDLWTDATQQYQDQLDLVKAQQKQNEDEETARHNAADYNSQNLATATRFASDAANAEVNSFKDRTGPDFGADFAQNFKSIGANPGAGQANINFKGSDFTFQAPDPVALMQQQLRNVLGSVSPYASIQTPAPSNTVTAPPLPQIPGGPAPTAPSTTPQAFNLAPGVPTSPVVIPPYGAQQPPVTPPGVTG